VLEEYVEPPMDLAIHKELAAFVDRRKADRGAETDF
jgi:trimethylamine---corrinoid protein Co-methyltransferase